MIVQGGCGCSNPGSAQGLVEQGFQPVPLLDRGSSPCPQQRFWNKMSFNIYPKPLKFFDPTFLGPPPVLRSALPLGTRICCHLVMIHQLPWDFQRGKKALGERFWLFRTWNSCREGSQGNFQGGNDHGAGAGSILAQLPLASPLLDLNSSIALPPFFAQQLKVKQL